MSDVPNSGRLTKRRRGFFRVYGMTIEFVGQQLLCTIVLDTNWHVLNRGRFPSQLGVLVDLTKYYTFWHNWCVKPYIPGEPWRNPSEQLSMGYDIYVLDGKRILIILSGFLGWHDTVPWTLNCFTHFSPDSMCAILSKLQTKVPGGPPTPTQIRYVYYCECWASISIQSNHLLMEINGNQTTINGNHSGDQTVKRLSRSCTLEKLPGGDLLRQSQNAKRPPET